MKFCSQCGQSVSEKIPDGDNRLRYVCDQCGMIHYQNPKIVTGCIVEWQQKILFCKRAIEPRYGFWTLPAGFMENGETVQEAAGRETWEEAYARVTIHGLYALYSIPHISQVYMLFRARLDNQDFGPGPESLEVTLFSEADIPWGALAFPVIEKTLKHYFRDRQNDQFPLHVETLYPMNNQ